MAGASGSPPQAARIAATAAGKDHTVPPAISKSTYKLHHEKSSAVTDLHELPDADHSPTVDPDRRRIADDVLAWLEKKGR